MATGERWAAPTSGAPARPRHHAHRHRIDPAHAHGAVGQNRRSGRGSDWLDRQQCSIATLRGSFQHELRPFLGQDVPSADLRAVPALLQYVVVLFLRHEVHVLVHDAAQRHQVRVQQLQALSRVFVAVIRRLKLRHASEQGLVAQENLLAGLVDLLLHLLHLAPSARQPPRALPLVSSVQRCRVSTTETGGGANNGTRARKAVRSGERRGIRTAPAVS
eukprot:scaffold48_cov311-Pinguiococcus_pyrenoidosus.AAC.223